MHRRDARGATPELATPSNHETTRDVPSASPRRRFLRAAACAPLLMAGAGALPTLASAQRTRKAVETPGKTWLEVSVNGPWSRDRQPGIPISVKDIVAQSIDCARAGAAVIHVHAYDEKTGRQKDDADLYIAIIEGIREKVDVVVYPTLPFAGSVDAPNMMSAQQRFAQCRRFGEREVLAGQPFELVVQEVAGECAAREAVPGAVAALGSIRSLRSIRWMRWLASVHLRAGFGDGDLVIVVIDIALHA